MRPDPKHTAIKLNPSAYRKLQRAVHERDGNVCAIPGCWKWTEHPPHHIKFRSQGGDDTMENLVTLCYWCHHMFTEARWKGYVEDGYFFYFVPGSVSENRIRTVKL